MVLWKDKFDKVLVSVIKRKKKNMKDTTNVKSVAAFVITNIIRVSYELL